MVSNVLCGCRSVQVTSWNPDTHNRTLNAQTDTHALPSSEAAGGDGESVTVGGECSLTPMESSPESGRTGG